MRFIIIAQAMIPYPTILMIYVQFRTDMASVSMQCYLDMSSRQTRVKTDMAEELDQLYYSRVCAERHGSMQGFP